MFLLDLALTTEEPPAILTVALPLDAKTLNRTLATSLSPVTDGWAPRAILTEPPPPELWATTAKLDELLILTNCNKLLEYDKFACTALTGSLPLFSRTLTEKVLPL
jgi:hypothetical protein